MLFFWLLTLDRLAVALGDATARTSAWLGVGLAWGAAMLSKYHAVLLPVGAVLYLVVRPAAAPLPADAGAVPGDGGGARRVRAGGPLERHARLGLVPVPREAVGGLPGVPARVRAGGDRRPGRLPVPLALGRPGGGPRPAGPPRARGGGATAEAFLVCQSVPVVVLFMGVSTFSRIMTHWPLIGFVALMPMLGRALSDTARRPAGPGAVLAGVGGRGAGRAGGLVRRAPEFRPVPGRPGPARGPDPGRGRPDASTRSAGTRSPRELKRRGLLRRPEHLPVHRQLAVQRPARAGDPLRVPVACYCRDARSFTFWSRPRGLGRPRRDLRPRRSTAWPTPSITPPGSPGSSRSPSSPSSARGARCRRSASTAASARPPRSRSGTTGPGPIPQPVGIPGARSGL